MVHVSSTATRAPTLNTRESTSDQLVIIFTSMICSWPMAICTMT